MLCSSGLESSIGLYFAKLGSVARERERVVCDDVMKEGVARFVQLRPFWCVRLFPVISRDMTVIEEILV